jgi:hypothetical protein
MAEMLQSDWFQTIAFGVCLAFVMILFEKLSSPNF